MPYEFGADETAATAFARCEREQLDAAIDALSQRVEEEPARATHDARKAVKKARSLLRLVRGAAPRSARRRANASLRAAGRELSAARDSEVLAATLTQLSDRFAGQLPATTFAALGEYFARAANGHRSMPAGGGPRAAALEQLRALRQDVDDWTLSRDRWDAIGSGLVRSYSRGRKAFRRARASGSLGDLHEWRKRVKDLWYQERLIAPVCGQTIRGHAKDAHLLADLLGDDHDLGMLREQLTGREVPVPVDVDAVTALIDHRREELQAEAFAVGARLYAEAPKAFKRRMRRSFDAGVRPGSRGDPRRVVA